MRPHTLGCGSIRQHTSVYVSIRLFSIRCFNLSLTSCIDSDHFFFSFALLGFSVGNITESVLYYLSTNISVNLQYRYGGTTTEVMNKLYSEGTGIFSFLSVIKEINYCNLQRRVIYFFYTIKENRNQY